MSLKGLIKKIQVRKRKTQKIDIPISINSEIQFNLVYCRFINPEDLNNLLSYTNIIIEFYYENNYDNKINDKMEDQFIELCNTLGFKYTEFINIEDQYTWIGLSITDIDSLKYLAIYLSKTPKYCDNTFVKLLAYYTKTIPYINSYIYGEDTFTDGYDSNDKNICIKNSIGDLHKDCIDNFDTIILDSTNQNIKQYILPLAGVIYTDDNNITHTIPLQNFIYSLAFEYNSESPMAKDILCDYSNNIILGKHIYKDIQYFIDLPLPIDETDDNDDIDSNPINDLYYEDIDEVIDK